MSAIASAQSGNWNDPNSWGSLAVPDYGDKVIINTGHIITCDGECKAGTAHSTSLSSSSAVLNIKGQLKASRTVDSNLRIRGLIWVEPNANAEDGVFDWGRDGDEIPENVTATIYSNDEDGTGYGYYHHLYAHYGNSTKFSKVYMKGATYRRRMTWLTQVANANDTQIVVNDATGWKAGDELHLAQQYNTVTSDPRTSGFTPPEKATIQSVNGNTITLTAPLQHPHGYTGKDMRGGLVGNMTSNVRWIGGKDNTKYGYMLKVRRAISHMENVAFINVNDVYNYVACIVLNDIGYQDAQSTIFRHNAMSSDTTGITNRYTQNVLYTYGVYGKGTIDIQDVIITTASHSSRYSYRAFAGFYGGRQLTIKDMGAFPMARYMNIGLDDYQQPIDFINCVSVCGSYLFSLHDNVDTTTNNCLAIGGYYTTQTYNGTAIHNDLRASYARHIGIFLNGWRGKSLFNRLDYDADKVYFSNRKDFMFYATELPDGNQITLKDILGDPTQKRIYYTYGQSWYNTTDTKTDPIAYSLYSRDATHPLKYIMEQSYSAKQNETVSVSFFVKNHDSDFDGTMTVRLVQNGIELATKTIDLSTLTKDEWNLIGIEAVSQLDAFIETHIEFLQGANGKEITIADLRYPVSVEIQDIVRGVWDEPMNLHTVSGSFGQAVRVIKKWVGWLRSLL